MLAFLLDIVKVAEVCLFLSLSVINVDVFFSPTLASYWPKRFRKCSCDLDFKKRFVLDA